MPLEGNGPNQNWQERKRVGYRGFRDDGSEEEVREFRPRQPPVSRPYYRGSQWKFGHWGNGGAPGGHGQVPSGPRPGRIRRIAPTRFNSRRDEGYESSGGSSKGDDEVLTVPIRKPPAGENSSLSSVESKAAGRQHSPFWRSPYPSEPVSTIWSSNDMKEGQPGWNERGGSPPRRSEPPLKKRRGFEPINTRSTEKIEVIHVRQAQAAAASEQCNAEGPPWHVREDVPSTEYSKGDKWVPDWLDRLVQEAVCMLQAESKPDMEEVTVEDEEPGAIAEPEESSGAANAPRRSTRPLKRP